MRVFVAIYTHKHGTDVFVYATAELVERARQEIAQEWWEHETGRPIPTDKTPEALADQYFALVADREWFEVEECEVQGATLSPATEDKS